MFRAFDVHPSSAMLELSLVAYVCLAGRGKQGTRMQPGSTPIWLRMGVRRTPETCTEIKKHVGCDGVVGSDKRLDTCGVCGGDNSTCRVISGLFTRPQLPVGYNLITQIPTSACNLTISELKQSRNYLALRRHDGSFVLNGNWAINWSGDYEAAGTKFTYHREDDHTPESIYSPGPLQEPLDLMVIYQQPNPGIKYQYQLPLLRSESVVYPPKDAVIAPPLLRHSPGTNPLPDDLSSVKENSVEGTRHNRPVSFPYGNGVLGSETQGYSGDEAVKSRPKRKRKFAWKVSGYTECTKSCGGGVQTSIVLCVREHNQMSVPERRCAALEKPLVQTVRCNVKPCVAEWVAGEWSECSVTCGEGMQTREIICRQEISPTLIMTVAEGACLTPPSPLLHRTRSCQRPPCPGASVLDTPGLFPVGHALHSSPLQPGKWEVGTWSQCSAQCGLGVRTRKVSCPTGDCPLNDKPISQAVCDMGSCTSLTQQAQPAAHSHSHNWFYTEWSNQCSESCGTGVQTRKVHCSAGPDLESLCDAASKPENSRACSSDKLCGGQWFTGPWGQCSASCGWGRHSRTVACIAKVRGELVITSDSSCAGQDKPVAEQQCRLQPCGSEWYTADWSQCSRSCDTGLQRREVRCLDENQVISNLCTEDSKPATRQSCNSHHCQSAGDESTGEQPHQENQALPAAQASQVEGHSGGSHEQAVHTEPVISSDGSECVDKFRNCHLVVQARLCKYKYYRSSCCQACHNKV